MQLKYYTSTTMKKIYSILLLKPVTYDAHYDKTKGKLNLPL